MFFLSRESDQATPEIDHETGKGDHQDAAARNSGRRLNALERLDKKPNDDAKHDETVHKGCNHFDAAVPEVVHFVGTLGGDAVGDERKKQACRVGHHVARIADKRERIGPDAAREFDGGEPEREEHRKSENRESCLLGGVRVDAVTLFVGVESLFACLNVGTAFGRFAAFFLVFRGHSRLFSGFPTTGRLLAA